MLVTGKVIYPKRRDLFGKHYYLCALCDAYVGCHDGTLAPFGRLANRKLRAAKQAAHAVFDPLWRSGRVTRKQAYAWLAKELGITTANCHIGMFDEDVCASVVQICRTKTFSLFKEPQ